MWAHRVRPAVDHRGHMPCDARKPQGRPNQGAAHGRSNGSIGIQRLRRTLRSTPPLRRLKRAQVAPADASLRITFSPPPQQELLTIALNASDRGGSRLRRTNVGFRLRILRQVGHSLRRPVMPYPGVVLLLNWDPPRGPTWGAPCGPILGAACGPTFGP